MPPYQVLESNLILTAAYNDYRRELGAHAFFKVRDQLTSQDLVQDTFIKTWHYLVRGGRIDTMKAFLFHVLNHLIIDEYRKRKVSSLEVLLEEGFEPWVDNSERLFNVLDGQAAFLLIELLPPNYKKVTHMRYVQGLSLQEMSLITGQSKNSIAVQLHRGLEKLKLLYTRTQFTTSTPQ